MLIKPTLIVLCSSMKSVEKQRAKKGSEKGTNTNIYVNQVNSGSTLIGWCSLLQIKDHIDDWIISSCHSFFSLPHKSTSRCHFSGVWQSKNRCIWVCAEGGSSYTPLWLKALLMIYEAHIHIFYVSLFFVRRHSGREISFQKTHLMNVRLRLIHTYGAHVSLYCEVKTLYNVIIHEFIKKTVSAAPPNQVSLLFSD